jgi:hypothetical protein
VRPRSGSGGPAAELGYRANSLARALPTGRTSMIALAISDITNPFYNEIIRGWRTAATETGYTILLADAQESAAVEREALDRAMATVDRTSSAAVPDRAAAAVAYHRPVTSFAVVGAGWRASAYWRLAAHSRRSPRWPSASPRRSPISW